MKNKKPQFKSKSLPGLSREELNKMTHSALVSEGNDHALGYEHTSNAKKQISKFQKGRLKSEEHKNKLRDSNKGIPRSKQARVNISNGHKKLNSDQVKEIRSKYIPRKYSTHKLAKEYGVSQPTIVRILKDKSY